MNRKDIVHKIISVLQAQLDSYTRAAQDAHAAATDPGSKAENKYDTRSLEASYLARGQALRVAETEQALRDFSTPGMLCDHLGKTVALGSFVMLESQDGHNHYFIGPAAGGMEVESEGQQVMVITPVSPLGRQLHGRKQGERFQLQIGTHPQSVVVSLVQ